MQYAVCAIKSLSATAYIAIEDVDRAVDSQEVHIAENQRETFQTLLITIVSKWECAEPPGRYSIYKVMTHDEFGGARIAAYRLPAGARNRLPMQANLAWTSADTF
jgi:hypothetical protein